MVLPDAVKEGQPAYGWCEQFKQSVAKKTGEAWSAGMVAVRDTTPNSQYMLSNADNLITTGIGIIAEDAVSTADMGVIFTAPAIVYSKYIAAPALKVYAPAATIVATTGRWAAGTDANAFAQVYPKASQGYGSLVKDITDIAQNEIVKLRLIK